MMRDSRSAVDDCLKSCLLPEPLGPPDLSPAEWDEFWKRARNHGLTAYLHQRWSEEDRISSLPPEMAARFSEARVQNSERNRRILRETENLLRLMGQRNIPVLVSKGLSLAPQYGGDIGLRVLYDLDLMVPRRDRGSALDLLLEEGYVFFFPESGRRREQILLWRPKEYRWDAERVFDPDRPIMLEVHTEPWKPDWHGFRLPGNFDYWSNARILEVGGVPLPAASEEAVLVQLLVHLACNALESVARLMHLLDIGLILRRRAGALDWNSILRRTSEGDLARFCCLALELACDGCGCKLPAGVREAFRRATPVPILRRLEIEGSSAIASMSIYQPNRSMIYFLHWNMAQGWGTKRRLLLFSLSAAAREGTGARRWHRFIRRMLSRLRHLPASLFRRH